MAGARVWHLNTAEAARDICVLGCRKAGRQSAEATFDAAADIRILRAIYSGRDTG
jgi:hypothetical protein